MSHSSTSLVRVRRDRVCVICGHDMWCVLIVDGLDRVVGAICPRVEQGAVRRCGEAGYLFWLGDRAAAPPNRLVARLAPPPPLRADQAELAATFRAAAHPGEFARSLGVSAEALHELGIGWCERSRAWSFPMYGPDRRVVGIRLRSPWRKFAVTGSRQGLFLSAGFDPAGPLWVCEGESDTAAVLTAKLPAVGRPGCTGGAALLVALVRRHRIPAVVIVSDRDEHERGQSGARDLAGRLAPFCPDVRLLVPPLKDAREWLKAVATRQDFLDSAGAARPWQLAVRTRAIRGGRHG